MKKQQVVNLELTYEILDFILDNPNLRFIQALWALGIVNGNDKFYELSEHTLERVRARRKEINTYKEESKCQQIKKDFQGKLKSS